MIAFEKKSKREKVQNIGRTHANTVEEDGMLTDLITGEVIDTVVNSLYQLHK